MPRVYSGCGSARRGSRTARPRAGSSKDGGRCSHDSVVSVSVSWRGCVRVAGLCEMWRRGAYTGMVLPMAAGMVEPSSTSSTASSPDPSSADIKSSSESESDMMGWHSSHPDDGYVCLGLASCRQALAGARRSAPQRGGTRGSLRGCERGKRWKGRWGRCGLAL